MSPMTRPERLLSLSGRLGHRFSDTTLLETALTHRSFANEVRDDAVRDNERLEFLGDAVIDLYVSEKLFARKPQWAEGDLSRARASLVNEKALADVGRQLGLGTLLQLGKGESKTGGRHKDSILCGAVEALVGATFIDGGIEAAWNALDLLLDARIRGLDGGGRRIGEDAKTALQEYMAGGSAPPPRYAVLAEDGPPHQRTFTVSVSRGDETLALGSGSSKKVAEQRAAAAALIHLKRMAS
jgi:ribonuclease III